MDREHKSAFFNFPRKLSLIFILLAIILAGGISAILYITAGRQMMNDIRTRLSDIAGLGANIINVDIHNTLKDPSQEGSTEYRLIQSQLQTIRDSAHDIFYVYTMRGTADGSIIFIVDAETNPEEVAHLGETYDDLSPLLQNTFQTMDTPVVENEFYTDEWGTWLSGYVPLFDSKGERSGVLGIDISGADVQTYKKKLLLRAFISFMIFLPVILLLGIFVGRRIGHPVLRIKNAAEQIGSGLLETRIEMPRNDEIGELARSLNGMAENLKQNQIKMEELVNKYRNIFDNASEGIFQTTIDGEIITLNNAMAELIGYSTPKEAMESIRNRGENLYAEPPDWGNFIQSIQGKGRIDEFRTELLRRDGSTVSVEMHAHLTEGENKEKIIESIVLDITERISREKAEQDRIVAEAASVAKSGFLANMSHEIRTPLNAVMGLSDLLGRTELAEKQREYVKKIRSSSQTLLALINDILDFSKIEAGRLELENISFSLFDILENLTEMFAYKAAEKEIELLVSVDEKIPTELIGDPTRLGQIFINLISNAIKFTDSGEIIISIRPAEKVSDPDSDTIMLEFSVADTGVGIPEEKLHSIFNSFSQADQSITRKYGGTGLGLAISKELSELMGGSIHAERNNEKGTTFIFTAGFEVQHPDSQIRIITPGSLKGINVLIVDDNKTSLDILKNIITSFDMNADIAESGVEALEKIGNQSPPYDLVLLDWKMPHLNGLETARKIKKDSELSEVPIICMISAYGREDLIQESDKSFLDAFLHKPVNQSLLFDTIVDLFGGAARSAPPAHMEKPGNSSVDTRIRFPGARVLLVEDNEINREIALEWLESEGIDVRTAMNGLQCLEKLDEEQFDAVLMDIQMPEMDGLEATRRIRKDSRFSKLPVIAMTAHALKGDREKGLEAGMNDYITKPIDPKKLFSVLAKFLPQKKEVPAYKENTGPSGTLSFQSLPGILVNNGLYRANNKPGLYAKILASFYKDFGDAGERIKDFRSGKNEQELKRLVHSLKGVSANIGAEQLSEAAAVAEAATGEDDPVWEKLDTELTKVMAGLSSAELSLKERASDPRARQNGAGTAAPAALIVELLELVYDDISRFKNVFETSRHILTDEYGMEIIRTIEEYVSDFMIDEAGDVLKKLSSGAEG